MEINKKNLPAHVAIIMDGNGRWAKKKNRPRIFGHNAGAKTVRKIVEASREIGVKYLTLYAFSSENWKRPEREVDALMRLLKRYLKTETEELNKQGIKLKTIGRTYEFVESVQLALNRAKYTLKDNKEMTLILALNYGSRIEICDAVNAVIKEGKHKKITPGQFEKYLYTEDIPDVDLLIRTSGEMRISNFLLYQSAYAELWITDTLWPDFTKEEYFKALSDFSQRQRRFGDIK